MNYDIVTMISFLICTEGRLELVGLRQTLLEFLHIVRFSKLQYAVFNMCILVILI